MDTAAQLLAIAASAFVIGLSGAMMPGPLLAVTITETARRGPIAGPLLMVGHMILEAVLVLAVALGLAAVLKHPTVIGCISLAGGAVMLWMGQGMLRSAKRATLDVDGSTASTMHPVAAGIVVSLSNPYWTIWWATIGIGYLVMGARYGAPGVLAFFIGHILSDFAWYTLVSVALAQGRRILPDRVYRVLIALCGAALLAFGAWFLSTGAAAFV